MKPSQKKDLNYIKDKVDNMVVDLGERIEDLVSITPVGSCVEGGEYSELNDYDLVFVFNTLKKNYYDRVVDELSKLAKELSTDEIGVIVETRAGSVKTKTDRPITFQIHAVFLDRAGLRLYEDECPIVLYDWYRSDSIYGKRLDEISSCQRTVEDVIRSFGGINQWENRLRSKMQGAYKIVFQEDGSYTVKDSVFPVEDWQMESEIKKAVTMPMRHLYKVVKEKNERPSNEELQVFAQETFNIDLEKITTVDLALEALETIKKRLDKEL